MSISGPVKIAITSASAPAFVQACAHYAGNATSGACTLSSTVTSGHNAHAFLGYNATGSVTGVADDCGNTYTADLAQFSSPSSSAFAFMRVYTATNITGGSTCTITASYNTSTFNEILVAEDSGEATSSPLDVTSTNDSAGSSPSTTGSATTTHADIVWGYFQGGNNLGFIAISPFTIPTNGTTPGGSTTDSIEYYVQPSAGSIAATATNSFGYGAILMSYHP